MIEIPGPDQLPAAIRKLLDDSGMSQRAYAAHLGVSPKQLSTWLSGKHLPGGWSLLRICAAHGYRLAFLTDTDRETA